jgi:hypothetical protein
MIRAVELIILTIIIMLQFKTESGRPFVLKLRVDKLIKVANSVMPLPRRVRLCEGRHPELFENTGFPPSRE